MHPRIATALRCLDPSTKRPAWHGAPTLIGVLRGVNAKQALWRPAKNVRCIWQWTLHAAYWEHTVANRLTGDVQPFDRRPTDWPDPPHPADDPAWKSDRKLLKHIHARLVDIVTNFDPEALDRVPPGGEKWTAVELIHGIAEHDLWHTAQVKLIKRLHAVR